MNRRVVAAAVAVLAGHAILLTGALLRGDMPQPPLESKAITAELLSAPVAQPAGVQSVAMPAPPKPVQKPEQKSKPKTAPERPVVKPSPKPLPVSHEPSPTAIAAPQPASPAPAAPTEPSAKETPAAAAPSARPTMEIATPKEGAHLTCQIAQADYPSLSRRRGETGVVKVRFVVGLTGKIESAQVVQSSGFPRLDDAALEAIRSSPCQPYLQNGQPMRAAYTQPYNFTLDD